MRRRGGEPVQGPSPHAPAALINLVTVRCEWPSVRSRPMYRSSFHFLPLSFLGGASVVSATRLRQTVCLCELGADEPMRCHMIVPSQPLRYFSGGSPSCSKKLDNGSLFCLRRLVLGPLVARLSICSRFGRRGLPPRPARLWLLFARVEGQGQLCLSLLDLLTQLSCCLIGVFRALLRAAALPA